ncbi:tetratricopeptide repeat protein [Spirosoma oryzicola]|uniref:tetratricopeptide repeat protein n=1 Tax=Spirosoma oryzicola TaxID=2898794 RepID=UPI001E540B8F|nr:tetratricopeptide repeat protein [Spirosoma oryzicola]UHG90980.1 tetratricopeptide repeat protein [Spirosoma oryzicola]
MSSLFFWSAWGRTHRFTYLLSLFIVISSLILFVVAWAKGLGNVVNWDVLSELNELPVTFQTISDGLLEYAVNSKAYAVSEQFVASAMRIRPNVATALLVGISVAFVLLISAISRFDRMRYLVSMAVLILGLAFFRWEMLEIPGLGGNYLFLILTFLFGSVSYYFHAFRPDYSIGVRFGVFALLTILAGVALGSLSPVAFPAMIIVSYGMPVLLVFSIGFIFFIAAEIIAGLVWVTSVDRAEEGSAQAGQRRTLGFNNFLFASLLYLVNLVLIWLKNTKSIDWDVLAISPFALYLISVTLGVWGFRRLIEQQEAVSFRDSGAYLYTGLALLATLTMAYAFATANDPLVEMFEDAIVYTHLAMGLCFVTYVVINFLPIYQQNLPVYRVLYKPRRLELSLFRIVGFVVVVVLVAYGGLISFRQGVAGYYNGLGDYYVTRNEPTSANAFYNLALEQEFQNHKSNYSLASLALSQNNQTAAAFYFQQALLKQPNPQDYAGLSQTYLQTDLFFEAVKTLQRGLRAFPNSGELQNNLGYLYARTSVADSAYYYLKAATGNVSRDEVPESNLLAFYARNANVLTADSSLATNTTKSTYESYQANALVLRMVAQSQLKRADTTQPVKPAWLRDVAVDQGLSVGRFASLYNYALTNQQPDTSIARTIKELSVAPVNQDFTDDLLLARAVIDYNRHDQLEAFGLLDQLAEGDQQNGASYRSMAGLWLLDQGLYRRAAETFEYNSDTTSIYYRAVALTKANELALAQSFWETASKNDPAVASLKQVLYRERKPTSDFEKAFYATYRLDDPNRGAYWETIQEPSLKTVAGVALANDYLDQLQWRNAQLILSGLPDSKQLSPVAVSVRTIAALRLSAFRRSVGSAETMAGKPILPRYQAEEQYWLGQTYERTRQVDKAQQAYRKALQLAPLNPQIVSAAAQLERSQKQSKTAYDFVVKALPYNEDSPELLKTYVNLSLDLSLFDYAEDGLAKLQLATTPADYQAFLTTYQEKIASIENSRQKFLQ